MTAAIRGPHVLTGRRCRDAFLCRSAGISIGAGVRARVLSADSSGHVQLSARPSLGGLITGLPLPAPVPADLLEAIDTEAAPASLKSTELKINQQVCARPPSYDRTAASAPTVEEVAPSAGPAHEEGARDWSVPKCARPLNLWHLNPKP